MARARQSDDRDAERRSAARAGRRIAILLGLAAFGTLALLVVKTDVVERRPATVAPGTRAGAGHADPAALPPPPVRGSRFQNTEPGVHFVGTGNCVGCHPAEHRSFLETPHSRALGPTERDDHPPDGRVDRAAGSVVLATRRHGDGWSHRVALLDSDGTPLLSREFPIRYQIGSGNHSRSYLVESGPFLLESPLTWYRSRAGWDLSPGYDAPAIHAFERMADYGCLVCHAGRIETVEGNRFHTRVVEETIGCENCHGPGELHVRRWQDRPRPAPLADVDLTIVNPARLSREQSEQICAACHLRGVATTVVRGRDPGDFRPGLDLGDFRIDYFVDGDEDAMKVTGHFEQMRRSRCYLESRELTCTTCHDPHVRPAPDHRVRHFRQKCIDCHAERCGLEAGHRLRLQADDDCVACHMPRGDTDLPHFAFHHHRIGLHPVDAPREPPAEAGPPAQLKAGTSIDHLAAADRLRSLGLAYVEFAEKQRSERLMTHYQDVGRELLSRAHDEGIRDAATLATLAALEMALGNGREATRHAVAALSAPNASGAHENARFVLAHARLEAGDLPGAAAYLERIVTQRYRAEDWLLLAEVQEARGRAADARGALDQAARYNPFRPDVQRRLGEAAARAGDLEAAARHRLLERRLMEVSRSLRDEAAAAGCVPSSGRFRPEIAGRPPSPPPVPLDP